MIRFITFLLPNKLLRLLYLYSLILYSKTIKTQITFTEYKSYLKADGVPNGKKAVSITITIWILLFRILRYILMTITRLKYTIK